MTADREREDDLPHLSFAVGVVVVVDGVIIVVVVDVGGSGVAVVVDVVGVSYTVLSVE